MLVLKEQGMADPQWKVEAKAVWKKEGKAWKKEEEMGAVLYWNRRRNMSYGYVGCIAGRRQSGRSIG